MKKSEANKKTFREELNVLMRPEYMCLKVSMAPMSATAIRDISKLPSHFSGKDYDIFSSENERHYVNRNQLETVLGGEGTGVILYNVHLKNMDNERVTFVSNVSRRLEYSVPIADIGAISVTLAYSKHETFPRQG